MYARKRFDIGWLDLAAGLAACATTFERETHCREIEAWFAAEARARGAITCLSVRSGLDLYLRALALPRGSEVLMSALTIPDMWKIVLQHGLVPVPLDLDPRTLAPRIDSARDAATPETRAVLIAHLFGTRIDLGPWAELARERGWRLLEDCAQAFTGREFRGDPRADVSMFSFGPIKTAAALAGGVFVVADARVLAAMRADQAAWPVQDRGTYAKRLVKYGALKAVSTRLLYAGFVRGTAALGKDHDRVIQGSVRGFAGGDFFEKIRRQPSAPLCALIARRLRAADGRRVATRTRIGERLRALVGSQVEIPGADASEHSYWVFTIACDDPDRTVAAARAAGFDATRAASLAVVPAPEGRTGLDARDARALLARLVYLPVYPELPERKLVALARVLLASLSRPAHAPALGVEVELV